MKKFPSHKGKRGRNDLEKQGITRSYSKVEPIGAIQNGSVQNSTRHKIGLVDIPSRPEIIVTALAEYIDTLGLRPGERLPSGKELSEILGVASCSLREAMIILQTLGLVQARHGAGWFVGKFDPSNSLRFLSNLLPKFVGADMDQIMQARLSLEPVITRLATENINQEGIAALEQTLQIMRETSSDRYMKDFGEQDKLFHEILAQECGNNVLSLQNSILTGIFYSVQWLMPQGNYGPRMEQHQKIFDAVKSGASSKAEQAMTEHLEKSCKFIEENNHQPEDSEPAEELVR